MQIYLLFYFKLLCREWNAELSKSDASKLSSPSLAMAMIRTFGPYYAFLGIFTFIEECILRILQPLFMGKKGLITIS